MFTLFFIKNVSETQKKRADLQIQYSSNFSSSLQSTHTMGGMASRHYKNGNFKDMRLH